MGFDAEGGRRQYVSRTVHGDRRQAEVELTKLLRQVDEGAITPRSGSVGELCDAWYRQRCQVLSPPVAYNYRRIIDRFILPRWGATALSRLRVVDIDAWYAELLRGGGVGGRPLSASSVRRVHALFRTILEQGVRWGFLASNPAAASSPPPVRRHQVELAAAGTDFARLIEEAARVNGALPVFMRLALATGARRGELCALRWQDVDLRRGEVRIGRAIVEAGGVVTEKDTKTHQVRRVSIDRGTVAMLDAYRGEVDGILRSVGSSLSKEAFVFSHEPDGSKPWRPNYVTLAFCRLRDRLGLQGLRLHDLRHASASLLLASGVDVRTVSGRLGHAHASTTLDVYAHLIRQADQRAAGAIGELLDGSR